MKRLSSILFCIFIFQNIFAQQNQEKHTPFCGYDMVDFLAKNDLEYLKRHNAIEREVYDFFQKENPVLHDQRSASPPPYTLPVAVHIVHDGGAENITDAQVLQGIQDLNDAFANVGYYDPTTGVNTQIQFCLAKRDPDGNATTGINRVQTPLTDMILETDDITVKDLSRYDPLHYINIWVVKEICSNGFGCGVAGYAYFPASHGGPEDGIMMEAEFFGSSQAYSGVIIHEMGHYLGLYHTFQDGCTNNDCLADGDRVCDTPPDQTTAWIPCGNTSNSCSTDADSGFPSDQNDLFQDYMDYSDLDCYSVFTAGQTERMHWHIENVRASLLDSEGCNDPCTAGLTANFGASQNTLEVGGTVNFTNTSSNTTTSIWEIDGANFANSTDADYTFNSVGTFEICLQVGNADPNCSDVFCQNITVTCPVQAAFSTTIFYPAPGEMVNYTNSSSGASQYEWTVNGTPVSTDTDLAWSFDNEGIFEVCLISGNGLCEAQFCLPVFVASGPVDNCDNATFVRVFGGVDDDEEGMCIIPSGDGNLYLGGRSGSQTLLVKMDINGVPFWQRSFNATNEVDILSEIFVDSDGNLLVCGYGDPGNVDFIPYVFKYDPVADAVLWSWTYSEKGRSYSILEPTPGGDYILVQDQRESTSPGVGEDAVLREIDRNTGAMTGNLAANHNLGSSETFNSTVLHNGQLYITGRYTNGAGFQNMRTSVSRFDLAGNEIWSRLTHVPMNSQARLYGRDLFIENDEIISVVSGDDNGTSATITNFFLQKHNLDGDLIWVKKYEIPSMSNEWVEEVISVNDGFIMYGHERASPNELFVVKTDKNGEALWGKSYGDLGNESIRFTNQSQIFAAGNFIYFTGWSDSFNGTRDAILVKTDSEGNLEDDCLLGEDIEVSATDVANPTNAEFDLIDYPNPQSEIAGQVAPEVPNVPFQDLEGCACVPDGSGGCDTTFLKTYGTFQDDEDSRAIAIVPQALGGGFLLGGGKADSAMITFLTPAGDITWTRSFDATPFADDFIWDIQFDSDNMVMGVGNTKNEPQGNVECFAFRYDMANNIMLWINELDMNDPARESYQKILEKSPGGNYVVSGETDNLISGGTGCDAILIELDRNTGANVWQRNMHFGSCETFLNAITADGGIYAVGRYNFDGGGQNRFRPGISKFDLNGNQLWSRWYLEGPAPAVARLYGRDMVEDNGLVVFGYGDDNGISTLENELFLYRTDYDGNLEWAMQYEIPGSQNERGIKILNIPDGYLCLGFHDSPDINSFIFKTDKQGNLQWAKNYGDSAGDEKAWDMIWQSGQVYFTGQTDTPTGGVSDDIFLANISADGTTSAQDSCNLFTDLEMTQAVWEDPYDEQQNLEDLSLNFFQFLNTAIMGETAVQSTVECFIPCLDTCDLVMDAAFGQIAAFCAGDSIQAIIEVCNLADFPIVAGLPVTIYDGDPTAASANVVTTTTLPSNVDGGECFGLNTTISANANQAYFILLNEDGSTPTPIDLNGFEGAQDECIFGNNLASFTVDFQAPPLDLGPDISACENQAVTLDAGPGFVSYEWSDLSEMQTLTAYLPGTYSVTVTDTCGGTQSDEVTISIDPASVFDLGPDQSVCEGGTIGFDLAGIFYENFEWTPGTGVTCLNAACSEAEISPSANTTYVVTASTADGCVSSDSIHVSVSPGFDTSESLEICDGQTVIVFGEAVNMAGVFSETFTSAGGCDSVHTVTVSVLDTYESIEDVALCEGDTVLVFGNPVFAEGEFSETFTASNGCDSTVTISVGFLESFQSFEDAVICEGDTLMVFGQPVTGAGEFSEIFTASNGCDSTVTISVGVLDTVLTQEDILLCWGDSVIVFGETIFAAGEYSMTFMGENGCDSTHVVTVTGHPKIFILPQKMDATCFGGSDGSAFANVVGGGLGEITYLWNTGETTPMIDGLVAGAYTVTATDGLCPEEAEFIIGQPDEIILSASGENVGCDELGSASATATGGTGDITFEWSTGAASPNIDGLVAGIYEVTATDANGCMATTSVEITGALGPDISIAIDQLPSEDEPMSGALSASTTGGTAPFDFAWNNGAVGASQTGLASGQYEVTVTDANGCTATAVAQIYIPACTGGKIWNDTNRDGCQDGGELGIGGIELELNGTDIWGNAITMMTTSAINGEYIFEPLPPGDFVVTLPLPAGYQYSPENACTDDFTDSDFDMNGQSYTVGLAEGHCCLVVDGGLFDECQNVFAPGEICCDQMLCGPGADPAPITSVSPAAGANAMEYMWVFSTDGVTWTGIPNTNTAGYDPGPISETTQFARCVRALGCTDWLETEPVTITVDDVAVAVITAPQYLCVGMPASFSAAPNPMGATYTWHFGPTASPSTATGQNATVTFNSFGYPTITLSVEYAGCTSTATEQVAVSDSPIYCTNAQQNANSRTFGLPTANFSLYPNPATNFVTLNWSEGIASEVTIQLLRVDGRTLATSKVDGTSRFHEVDLSGAVSGIYFLKVEYGKGEMEVFRVVRE